MLTRRLHDAVTTSKQSLESKHEPRSRAASVDTHPLSDMEPGTESDGDLPILSASRCRKRAKSSKDAGISKVPDGSHAHHTIIRAKHSGDHDELRTKVNKSKSKARKNAEITSGSSAKHPKAAQLRSNSSQAPVGVAAAASRRVGSNKRRAKAVSECSEEDAL